MEVDFTLRVEGLFVGIEPVVSQARDSLIFTLAGVTEDRHTGHTKSAGVREKRFHPKDTPIFNARSWSAVSVEDLASIAESMGMPEVKAEWLGANLLLSGHQTLTKLPPLTRLVFPSGATLLVYQENLPCVFPAKAMTEAGVTTTDQAKLFAKAALGKRGIVGWVERAGAVHLNEEVSVYLYRPPRE